MDGPGMLVITKIDCKFNPKYYKALVLIEDIWPLLANVVIYKWTSR